MRRLIALPLVAACMVTTACSETATPARDASNEPPAVEVIAAEPVPETAPATAEIGYYTIGDARVTLADALVLPGEPGEVTLMLTPTALTAEERVAVLASATWPGMPLIYKRTADYPDRYPFVTAKLSYQGTLAPADYSGGLAGISNLGMYGISAFSAIINPPQSMNLAVGGIETALALQDGQPVERSYMRLTLSVDHRAIDGAAAAQLLARLKTLIETPLLLAA